MNSKRNLSELRVASPCHANWDEMAGDNQSRFCGSCKKNVYNLSEMTQVEAESLIMEKEGRLCVRYYRRSDGTVLTKDCPKGIRAVRQRFGLALAAAFAVLFSATGCKEIFGNSESKKKPAVGGMPEKPEMGKPKIEMGEYPVEKVPPKNELPTMGMIAPVDIK